MSVVNYTCLCFGFQRTQAVVICENTNVSNNRFTKLLQYTNKTLWSVGHTDGQKSRHSMCANNKAKKRENIIVPSEPIFCCKFRCQHFCHFYIHNILLKNKDMMYSWETSLFLTAVSQFLLKKTRAFCCCFSLKF